MRYPACDHRRPTRRPLASSVAALLCGSLLLTGCSDDPPPAAPSPTPAADTDPDPAPAASAPTTAPVVPPSPDEADPVDITESGVPLKQAIADWRPSPNPRELRFFDFIAPRPATWIEHPPFRQNEITRLTAPGSNTSNAAEVVVLYYGRHLRPEHVIEDWARQFRPAGDETLDRVEPITRDLEVAGTTVTLAALEGDHLAPFAGYYRPNRALVGAVIRTERGPMVIRFLGEKPTIDARRADFIAMIEGLRRSEAADGSE